MKKLLIIKAGTTYPTVRNTVGDFDEMIIEKAGLSVKDVIVCPVYEGSQLPVLDDIYAAIITGSHDMVTDKAAWSLYLADWLRKEAFNRILVMGICYAHQLIAEALGGIADYHPKGSELGTTLIELTEAGKADPLMQGLPARFLVHVSHSQTVAKLPHGTKVLANSSFEPHQAVSFGHMIWGLQFHPEYSSNTVHLYIEEAKEALRKKGYDIAALHGSVMDCPFGEVILKRFIELAVRQ